MNDANEPGPAVQESTLGFEELLWTLFLKLMDVPGERVEDEILAAQSRLCSALGLDRSALWQTLPDDPGGLRVTHVYTAEHDARHDTARDGSVVRGGQREFLLGDASIQRHADASVYFPWAKQRVLAGVTTRVESLDAMPADAAVDAAAFRSFGTVSTVIVPLQADGQILGALSFATTTRSRQWPDDLVARLEQVGQVFAKALARKRADDKLREREASLQSALADLKRIGERLQHENVYLRSEIRERHHQPQIVGTSPAIRRVLAQVEQVAPTASTVLLLGETGTGKERFAAAIHESSRQRSRPMVTVNCAAMPATLIESELFGREKGAYTGALTRQIGRFELANDSTIFLDEIGDLPIETQTKLLRVIESREFERLGSPSPVRVQVRIIAATNRDLEESVRSGRFREDLFFRLNVFPITLPPLRERVEDIPLLVKAIVEDLCASMGRQAGSVPRACLLALQQYHWPGNIRELRNVIERALITANGPVLHIEPPAASGRSTGGPALPLKAVEREHVLAVLQQAGWRIRGPRGAAAILGLPPTTLENRMARLGIARPGK